MSGAGTERHIIRHIVFGLVRVRKVCVYTIAKKKPASTGAFVWSKTIRVYENLIAIRTLDLGDTTIFFFFF